MKIPKVERLPSGNYRCRLRLDGRNISVTEATKDLCIAKAMAIKAGALEIKKAPPTALTLREAIDRYIADRQNVLSPSTVRGYRIIQRNRFPAIMDKPIGNVKSWQRVINDEARSFAPKTVINAWGLTRTVLDEYIDVPRVRLPQKISREPRFLRPEQIKPFIQAILPSPYAVPALLALSSMRLSEIKALRWEDVPRETDFVRVSGSVVPDEHNRQIRRRQNKTVGSARNVPVLIPELREAIERDRGSGPVLTVTEIPLRRAINKACREIGADEVGIHGLRHSFASLAYHLNVPAKIAMEIGGWSTEATMSRIYTHIAESDIKRYMGSISAFYSS